MRKLLLSLDPGVHKVLFVPSEYLWQIWGLILNVISSLLPFCWGFLFTPGHRVSFFGGIQYSPVDGSSAVSCDFGVLAGEYECTSLYSTIFFTPKTIFWYIVFKFYFGSPIIHSNHFDSMPLAKLPEASYLPCELMWFHGWSENIVNKESKIQYLGAVSKMTEWSLFFSKVFFSNHSISQ